MSLIHVCWRSQVLSKTTLSGSYSYRVSIKVAGCRQAEAKCRAEARLGSGRWQVHAEIIQVDLGVRGHSVVVEVRWGIKRSLWRGLAVGHTAEDEVEGNSLLAAVELSLDLLRMGVWCELLAAALRQEEQAIVLRVRHFELVGAQLAHFLYGGVGSDLKSLSSTAAVQLLQRHTQVVLGNGPKTHNETGCLVLAVQRHDETEDAAYGCSESKLHLQTWKQFLVPTFITSNRLISSLNNQHVT